MPDQAVKLIGIARMAAEAPCLEPKRRVEYFELGARSYLARCDNTRVPFRWTINPYRGCEFGCKYCYARYTHEFMELRDPGQFERKIYAKKFNPVRFREELRRLPLGESIALGTATDPYQPAERRYRVTRQMLEVFASMAENFVWKILFGKFCSENFDRKILFGKFCSENFVRKILFGKF